MRASSDSCNNAIAQAHQSRSMAPISHYKTGACLWAPPTKWGQETRVDVAGVDALGPQGVALQVQRLGAIRF